MRILVEQLRLLTARGVDADTWLLIEDGIITGRGTGRPPELNGVERRSLSGRTVTPGFIDLHVHGGAGASFDDGPAAIETALAVHRAHGTTRSLVSLVARPLDELLRSLTAVADLADRDPRILGAHLEGPFLSPVRSAAHAQDQLRTPTPAMVDILVEAGAGRLAQITIAPELPGALDAITRFTDAGVIVAIGHTDADAATIHAAFDRGARLVTHAWNAMPGMSAREPGPMGASLGRIQRQRHEQSVGRDAVVLELIADGVHVAPDVVAATFAAAAGRITLVSDAMAAAGRRDGAYRLGRVDVTVTEGVARASVSGALAGSTLTLDRAMRMTLASGVPERDAIEALTRTPARVLGLGDRLGDLTVGMAADFLILDEEWRIDEVWSDGTRLVVSGAGDTP